MKQMSQQDYKNSKAEREEREGSALEKREHILGAKSAVLVALAHGVVHKRDRQHHTLAGHVRQVERRRAAGSLA